MFIKVEHLVYNGMVNSQPKYTTETRYLNIGQVYGYLDGSSEHNIDNAVIDGAAPQTISESTILQIWDRNLIVPLPVSDVEKLLPAVELCGP